MNWGKALGVGILVLGAVLLVRLVASIVFGVIGFLWTVVTTVLSVLIVLAALYGGYKLLSWARDDESATRSIDRVSDVSRSVEPSSRVEDLKGRYAEGQLSEEEFERRVERELSGPRETGVDRDRSRERP